MIDQTHRAAAAAPRPISPAREIPAAARFARQSLRFILIGLALYVGLFVLAEQLVYANTVRNRFLAVKTAPLPRYDLVILGASHAAVFDYEDMNARLEGMTGAHVLNLSTVGGGIMVNRLLLDYFLARHDTTAVVYFLDSFAFYSPQWNEERLKDTRLFDRAPLDPELASVLLRTPAARGEVLDYVTGFSKINNQDRFRSDIGDDEALRFGTTYRPIPQIDAQRIRYLYPGPIDEATFDRYLIEFEDLVRSLESRGVRLIVIKPPIPERVYRALPSEARFDERVATVLARHAVEFHDMSLVCNDERFFFNTDHLNRAGVLNYYRTCLGPVLVGPH